MEMKQKSIEIPIVPHISLEIINYFFYLSYTVFNKILLGESF